MAKFGISWTANLMENQTNFQYPACLSQSAITVELIPLCYQAIANWWRNWQSEKIRLFDLPTDYQDYHCADCDWDRL